VTGSHEEWIPYINPSSSLRNKDNPPYKRWSIAESQRGYVGYVAKIQFPPFKQLSYNLIVLSKKKACAKLKKPKTTEEAIGISAGLPARSHSIKLPLVHTGEDSSSLY